MLKTFEETKEVVEVVEEMSGGDGSDKERSRDGVSEVNVQQFKEEV
jgi:hypothetical protein